MEKAKEKSFEFAHEAIKLIITLGTGFLALTVTFLNNYVGDRTVYAKSFLLAGWFFFFVTIISGIWTILAITGTLDLLSRTKNKEIIHINNWNIKLPATITVLFFLLGIISFIVFAAKNIN